MKINHILTILAFVCPTGPAALADVTSVPSAAAQANEKVNILHVKDFGAIPDDGKCDIKQINAAIAAAAASPPAVIEFDAGTYNLCEPDQAPDALIAISKISDITLLGKTAPDGTPATIFERNVKNLRDHLDAAKQFKITDSSKITIRNIVSDNKPAFSSAGKITAVDKEKDIVEMEVFEGLPHFDGMQCFSANSWNLETRQLIPVKALTIGADPGRFEHQWQKVPGNNDRLYHIQKMGFADRVKTGQGISWHFYVSGKGAQFFIANSTNVTLENVHIRNIKQLGVVVLFCKDLTFRKVIVKPVAPQLAVGSRDAFHLVCNSGTLLVDSCYVKGVRWDPFNVKSKFCLVTGILDKRRIKASTTRGVPTISELSNRTAVFWTGERPQVLKIVKADWDNAVAGPGKENSRIFSLEFAEDLPATVKAGSAFTPHAWNFDLATFTNCTFEGNCGRPILYQGENLQVSNCCFNNNSYENIALGPIDAEEGGFVRNVIISGNKFINSTWDSTTSNLPHNGSVKVYQNCYTLFKDEPYNDGIVIKNNFFKGVNYDKDTSAISIANAQNVQISGNKFVDCTKEVFIDNKSTK